MTVAVRPIQPEDADGFVGVFEAVAAEGMWIGTELPVDDDRRARWRATAQQPSDDAFTCVAVDDGDVVGFAHTYLGRQLLDGCINWARSNGAHKVDLEVWPHNTAARRLYARAGFVVEGVRRRHWRRNSGELWDSIEMSLILDETSPGSPYGALGRADWSYIDQSAR